MTCRTARTATNDNAAARRVVADAKAELRAAGLPDDADTVAHLLAHRLIAAMQQVSAGQVRATPARETAPARIRPLALGAEMEPHTSPSSLAQTQARGEGEG